MEPDGTAMILLATLTGTGWISLGNSLIAMKYTIQVTKHTDGLITGKGSLHGSDKELAAFISSDGSDLKLETGDRIQIDVRSLRAGEADFRVIGNIPGFD